MKCKVTVKTATDLDSDHRFHAMSALIATGSEKMDQEVKKFYSRL